MTFRNAVAALVVLAAATVWAQSTPPVTAPEGAAPAGVHASAARRGPSRSPANGNITGTAELRQRMEDMESTVNKMHALLKQMRAKAGPSRSKDPLVKANLEMWELMLGDLDKQLDQLRTTLLARQDLEARRAAMYKQADDKANAAAQRARSAAASQATAPVSAGQGASAGSADQPAADAKTGQTPPTPTAPASGAPK